MRIAAHYFSKKIDKNTGSFNPNTQASDLEKTCKMIDNNPKDFNLSEKEISNKLEEIGWGNIIDL